MKRTTPEQQLQRLILDYLAAQGIMAFRMNTGAVKTGGRFFRFGVPGMADVLAFRVSGVDLRGNWCECIQPVWIECKAPKGVQSALQKSFQQQVEREGHRYIVARTLEEVQEVLG
jgi:hypothetical protein